MTDYKNLPSPNFDSREGQAIDMLVLHYTGMASARDALEKLCDPAAKVSAHYVVDEDGTVYRLVAEENRAWHAGVSSWRGHSNINQRSIGIEIVNPGHEFGYRAFPPVQMKALTALCKDIIARHTIPARNVVAHSDVAPARKEDPGELFDWKGLAEQGVGLWYKDKKKFLEWAAPPTVFLPANKAHSAVSSADPYSKIQSLLAEYGYNCPQTGILDEETGKVVLAFQRHFFPQRLTGIWDRGCSARLASLLQGGEIQRSKVQKTMLIIVSMIITSLVFAAIISNAPQRYGYCGSYHECRHIYGAIMVPMLIPIYVVKRLLKL